MKQEQITVKVKKLDKRAEIPFYSTDGSAGMDIKAVRAEPYTVSDIVYRDKIKYYTGLAFEIPEGHVMLLFPRSSVAKKELDLTNCVGVVDSDYRGEVTAVFRATKNMPVTYNIGERIIQAIVIPYPKVIMQEVEELSKTERGVGGYGSTGK